MIHSIVLLPLFGFVISCLFSFFKSDQTIDRITQIVTSLFISISAILSFYLFVINLSDPPSI